MENLHITIKFMGDVERDDLNVLSQEIQQRLFSFEKIELELDSCGYFGSKNFPRVIWLGVSGELEKFSSLAKLVESECEKIGVKKEFKDFSPHITLGRLKSPDNSNYLIARLQEFPNLSERFTVERIYIKESILRPEGPIYKDLYEILIGGK